MADKKNPGFIFYFEWKELLEDYSDAEVGQIIRAILNGEDTEFTDRGMKSVYKTIKTSAEHDGAKYQAKVENGNKGGRPKKEEKPIETENNLGFSQKTENNLGFCEKPIKEKKIKEKEIKENKKKEKEEEVEENKINSSNPPLLPEVDEDMLDCIIHFWNANECTHPIEGIPLLSTRYDRLRQCIGDDYAGFIQLILDLDNQAFFQEQAKDGNKLKFDWFIKADNFMKVKEGNYKTKYDSKKTIEERIMES